jgi:hypothetical protein
LCLQVGPACPICQQCCLCLRPNAAFCGVVAAVEAMRTPDDRTDDMLLAKAEQRSLLNPINRQPRCRAHQFHGVVRRATQAISSATPMTRVVSGSKFSLFKNGLIIPTRAAAGGAGIGLLNRAPKHLQEPIAAFRKGLGDSAYTEGRNVTIEVRWARNDLIGS